MVQMGVWEKEREGFGRRVRWLRQEFRRGMREEERGLVGWLKEEFGVGKGKEGTSGKSRSRFKGIL